MINIISFPYLQLACAHTFVLLHDHAQWFEAQPSLQAATDPKTVENLVWSKIEISWDWTISNIERLQDIPGETGSNGHIDWFRLAGTQSLLPALLSETRDKSRVLASWERTWGNFGEESSRMASDRNARKNCCGWLCYDMCNEDISYTTNKFGNQWPCVYSWHCWNALVGSR